MCKLEEVGVISCQISYLPIGTEKYLDDVEKVLDLIKASGLKYTVDVLSTTIRGDSDKVFNLISTIHREMTLAKSTYTMNIMISNICGC